MTNTDTNKTMPTSNEARPIAQSGINPNALGVQEEIGSGLPEAKGALPVFESTPRTATVRNEKFDWFGELPAPSAKPTLEKAQETPDEGEGQFMVVLVDVVIGANGVAFHKGDVRRLSKFVNGYGDEDRREEATNAFQRLRSLGAVRPADYEESKVQRIDVDQMNAPVDAEKLRIRAIAAEQELEQYKLAAERANAAKEKASPAKTGDNNEGRSLPDNF